MKKTKQKKPLGIKKREALYGTIFFSPWIIGFLLITAYPMIYSIIMSFSHVKLMPGQVDMTSAGGYFYKYLFTSDVSFTPALLKMCATIVVYTPVILVLSLIIAIMLNRKFVGRTVLRAIFFLPVIIMSGPVFAQLLQGDAAMVIRPSENILYQIIQTMPKAVNTPILFILDNFVSILWMSGVQIILFLASLQKIDGVLYEAASIDGATAWEAFWKITLPNVKPVILLNAIYTVVDLSNAPDNDISKQIALRMNQQGMQFSYSAAMSWVYSIMILLLLGVAFLVFNNWSAYKDARRERRNG